MDSAVREVLDPNCTPFGNAYVRAPAERPEGLKPPPDEADTGAESKGSCYILG